MTQDKQAVEAFWEWFSLHADPLDRELREAPLRGVATRLDSVVRELLGDVRWEIGPDGEHGWFFAFSLRGRLSNLEDNERLVAKAPTLSGWKFLASRPPKRWGRQMKFGDLQLDFREWRFSWEDGEVLYWPSDVPKRALTATQREGACWILLESELGEREALLAVAGVREARRASAKMLGVDQVVMAIRRETLEHD